MPDNRNNKGYYRPEQDRRPQGQNRPQQLLIQEPVLMVPVTGVEPVRYRYHRILSPTRLPIPSHRHITL